MICLPLHRVLLWRRDDNICYALLVGGSESVSTGDSVQCRIGGMLQVGIPLLSCSNSRLMMLDCSGSRLHDLK